MSQMEGTGKKIDSETNPPPSECKRDPDIPKTQYEHMAEFITQEVARAVAAVMGQRILEGQIAPMPTCSKTAPNLSPVPPSVSYSRIVDEGDDEDDSHDIDQEEQRIRRIAVYRSVIEPLPQLTRDNWINWVDMVRRLGARIRVRNMVSFCEAVLLYRGDDKVTISQCEGKDAMAVLEDAVRRVHITTEQHQYAIIGMTKLIQGPQESLKSYLARYNAYEALHPLRDTVGGDVQLKAILISGLNATARQQTDMAQLLGTLKEVRDYLGNNAESPIWNGFQTTAPPIFCKKNFPATRSEGDSKSTEESRWRKNALKSKWQARKKDQAESRETCWHCGWFGHKASECRDKES